MRTTDGPTARPNRLFRNLNAKIASIPMILTALVVFVGGTAWTVLYSFTNSRLLPRLNFIGLDQYERLWTTPRWLISIENLLIYGVAVADLLAGHRLPAGRAARPEDPLRGHVPHHLPLSLRAVLHRHRPGLAVDPQPGFRRPARGAQPRLGDLRLQSALHQGNRHLRHPDRRAVAGHRARHVPDAGRPARHRRGYLEGRARRRHPDVEDLSLHRHPDDAAGLHHDAGHHRQRHRARSTTLSWRRPAAARRSPPKCRPNTSTTTCSPRRISARALPPRP